MTAPAITPDRLGAIWPAASERLLRVLAMRGLDRSQAEDLVQDVGVRAIQSGVTFHDLDDFLCWAKPVVRNLHVDLIRSSKFSVSAAEIPDRESAAPGVEHVVERRLALQTVLHHLGAMPAGEREAIVAAASETPQDADARPGTMAVRRHRARARLRRMCGGALGVSGLAVFGRRMRAVGVASVVPAAFSVLVAVPAVVLGLHVAAGETVTAVHVAHPSIDEAVAVSAEPARVVNERPAGSVTRAASPAVVGHASLGHSMAATGQHVGATSKVQVRTGAHGRQVDVYERQREGNPPLVCVYTGRVVNDRCIAQPGRP